MNHKPQKLPHFTWLAALAGFSMAAVSLTISRPAAIADESPTTAKAADETPAVEAETPAPATPAAEEEKAASAGADASGLPSADEILTRMRAKIDGLDSLKCDLHQTSIISGMRLTAVGRYVEASGNRVHLRYTIFPMKATSPEDAQSLALNADPPVTDESKNSGVLVQVSDGTILSTSWKNGETHRVTRRNIRDILAAAQETSKYDPKNAAMDLGVGGLRGLFSRLQTTMEFAPVKSLKAGERTVLEVTGRWNEKVRKEIFRIPEGSLVDPRPQVPEYVRVYVDAETMLPRRIQFLKRSMNASEKMVRPMITLDLRNIVLNEPVEDDTFVFQAPKENLPEEDQTEQVIQMIQRSLQPDTASPGAESAPPQP